MAITTKAELLTAISRAQKVLISKNGTGGGVATGAWYSTHGMNFLPTPGALAGTSTAAGVVPVDTDAGYPDINSFGAGNTGYLGNISGSFSNAAIPQIMLSDVLFKAGAYAFNANVLLAGQPSYASRITGGYYGDTEIWAECVTAFTGIPTITITYTNQDGVAGQTSGAFSLGAALAVNRMVQIPLQAGDRGVQKIERVVGSVATAGTFNILVLRRLWKGPLFSGVAPTVHDIYSTQLPIIFEDSALMASMISGSNTTLAFQMDIEILNG